MTEEVRLFPSVSTKHQVLGISKVYPYLLSQALVFDSSSKTNNDTFWSPTNKNAHFSRTTSSLSRAGGTRRNEYVRAYVPKSTRTVFVRVLLPLMSSPSTVVECSEEIRLCTLCYCYPAWTLTHLDDISNVVVLRS